MKVPFREGARMREGMLEGMSWLFFSEFRTLALWLEAEPTWSIATGSSISFGF